MHAGIPVLGVGIGWRREIAKQIAKNESQVDWCEVISEHYINVPDSKLKQLRNLAKRFPVIPHGIDLSIGTPTPIEEGYLRGLDHLVRTVKAPWFTDHLCFTRVPGVNIGQLTTLRFTRATVDIVVQKVRALRERIATPFLLENITNAFMIPRSAMSETEFITAVLEEADIGMLLDLCNVFVNSQNHRYDPFEFLESLPLERVVQIHIAGGNRVNGQWMDSHSFPVHEEVFELLEFVVERAPVKGILLERDDNFPESFQELVEELGRAREIFNKHRPVVGAVAAV